MPIVETISIINKSGKVVSTTKHLVNIFKDAKEAYQEKKAEIRAEMIHKNEERASRKALRNNRIEEVQSEASSRHSRRHKSKDIDAPRRPALTERNLSAVSEASVTTSRRSSRHGSERSPRSPTSPRSPVGYKAPFFENADISCPDLARRHTDSLEVASHRPIFAPPQRTMSSPNMSDEIDMHLAYGEIHPDDLVVHRKPASGEKEAELKGLMSRLDKIMLEAHCIQHSAATIIATLQENPEAMAAVALTLAEISSLLSKMGPGVLAALKGGSPAIFALLASPQFLIAGGVAVGVTIVMFGGYKIIKKIRADAAERKEASRMDEALVYEGDLGSIESWRRGIAEEEARSIATSVDGEFITPEAARQRKERIRERAREERSKSVADSQRTVRRKDVTRRSTDTKSVVSESVRSESTIKPKRDSKETKETKETKEKKVKKSSALTVLFKKSIKSEKDKGSTARSKSTESHKPKLLEL